MLVVTKADLGATARRAEQDLRAALGALGARATPVLAVSSLRAGHGHRRARRRARRPPRRRSTSPPPARASAASARSPTSSTSTASAACARSAAAAPRPAGSASRTRRSTEPELLRRLEANLKGSDPLVTRLLSGERAAARSAARRSRSPRAIPTGAGTAAGTCSNRRCPGRDRAVRAARRGLGRRSGSGWRASCAPPASSGRA